MSLQGSLADFCAPDIFQLISQQRKTGILKVNLSARTLEICFRDGRVVRAYPADSRPDQGLADLLLRIGVLPEPALASARRTQEETLEPLTQILSSAGSVTSEELTRAIQILTHDTIFELFRWDGGTFQFRPEEVQSVLGDQDLGADQVLFDTVRKIDEWVRIEEDLPDLDLIPVPTGDVDALQAKRAAIDKSGSVPAEDIERLFMMSDGRRSARRVIDLAWLGTFEGAQGLVALAREELIRLGPPRGGQTKRASSGRARTGVQSLQGIQTLSALVLVGLVGSLLWYRAPAPPTELRVPSDVLSRTDRALDGERLRLALEVELWVSGSYPRSLEAWAEKDTAVLAPPMPAGYSYERFSGGYRLFPTYP